MIEDIGRSMEFTLDRLKIHQVGDIWRVVMDIEGVRHLTEKPSLQECFEALHKDRLKPDFRERLDKYKREVGIKQ